MKKTFLTCMGICLFFISIAQISVTNPVNNRRTFELSSVPTNPPLIQRIAGTDPGTSGTDTCSAIVFEYGCGHFTTDTITSHSFTQGNKKALLTLSGRYDTIKPPQLFANLYTISPPPPKQGAYTDTSHQSLLLDTTEKIRVTPIARDVNVRDEMLFIVTYRIPPNVTNPKILFFYNEQGFNAFEPINSSSSIDFGSFDVSRIRTYSEEVWVAAYLNNTSLPSPLNTVTASLTGTGYSNLFGWTFSAPWDVEGEHNIFVSLKTKNNLPSDSIGHVEAILYYEKNDVPQLKLSTVELIASVNPHDPNYINVTPKCILTGKGTTQVNYHLHFQNEGGGTAHRLKIKIDMDSRLKNAIAALTQNSFRIITGRKPVNNADFILTKYSNTLELEIHLLGTSSSRGRQSNINDPIDSSLGSNKVPAWYCNPLTMGDIYFQLDVPDTAEADFITKASIIFYNQSNTPMPAVETVPDTLFVRNQCTGNILPHIIPLKTCPACTPCCTKFVGLCWWWWIIIGLALLLIISLLSGKKRNKEGS